MKVEWVQLGDILELQRRDFEVHPDSTYREIGVRSFGKGLFIKPSVQGAELGDKRVFEIRAGDFVVSNVFAWEGAVGVASREHDGLIGSHRFMTWTPRGDVNVEYLRHYFGSDAGVASLAKASPGSAGRNRTLSIKNFERLVVPLPKRGDQDRIETHLSQLSQIRSRPNSPAVARERTTTRLLADSPRTTLGALLEMRREPVELVPGRSYQRIGIYSWGKGMLRRAPSSASEMGSMRYFMFPLPSLIFSNIQAWEGAVALADDVDRGYVCSSRFYPYVPRPGTDVDLRYLFEYFRTREGVEQLRQASPGTQVRNKVLSRSMLEATQVPVPAPNVQHHVVTQAQILERIQATTSKATRLESAILPAARNEIFDSMR